MSPEPQPRQKSFKPVIDYATPRRSRRDRESYALQVILGFLASIATAFPSAMLAATVAQGGPGWVGRTIGLALLFNAIFLGLVCMAAYSLCHWRGFPIGALIGFLLLLLAVGVCFSMIPVSYQANNESNPILPLPACFDAAASADPGGLLWRDRGES